jgi:hypothetical protein
MKKGRIVQFADSEFAYQKLLLGFIPLQAYLTLSSTESYNWHHSPFWCKHKTLESLKEQLKKLENYKNPDKIVRVVKETELEKALE